jgi:NADPH-dependent curcumin reductase CurA
MPRAADWTVREVDMPVPKLGEVLCRAIYLDVAPYMRGRISPQKNYAAGVRPGDMMVGGAIVEVIESRIDGVCEGCILVSDFDFGWQEYGVLKTGQFRHVDTGLAPMRAWLDVLGLNGITAYFGLLERGSLKAGDCVVVSAAAGSVGQLVGQIGKIAGARVVGVTSSKEKAASLGEFGFAEAVAYRGEADLAAALKTACPQGVDVFFDNTAGDIHDAVMQNLAPFARVVVCGTVSLAGRFEEPDMGQRFLRQILVARAEVRGFLVLDYQSRYDIARGRLGAWLREGRIGSRYDIAAGFEQTPAAFIRLLRSENIGKQLVQIREEPGD